MASKAKNLFMVAVFIAVSVAGSALFREHDENVRALAAASVDWPSVPGLVTRSELRRSTSSSGRLSRRDSARVDVVYEFVVDDQVYRNSVIRFDQGRLSVARKERLVSSFPVGKRVEVFYNPGNPDESVLVRDAFKEDR